MELKKIVEFWLRGEGYEGLFRENCACEVDDLMPCGEPGSDCEAGYKVPCLGKEYCGLNGDCSFHISKCKPKS